MEHALIVRTATQEEIDIHRGACHSAFAIHSSLPLFHFGRVPFQIVVNDVPAEPLEINPFLTNGARGEYQWLEGRVETPEVGVPLSRR